MHTTGEESIIAVAMPVTMLVAPGPDVAIATSDSLNTYDILRPDKLLFTQSAFEKVEARLTKE